MPTPRSVPAPLLVLAAIVSVQVGAALAKTLFDNLGAAGVTLLRLGLAALVLLLVARPRVGRWSGGTWRATALLGVTMAAMNLAFYLSLRTVPLGVAVTVEFVGPLLLALVQPRRLLDLLWVVLAGAGVVLLGLDRSGPAELSGLGLALLAGLFWAGYILASARVGRELAGLDGLAVAVLIAAVLVVPFGAAGLGAIADRPALLVAGLGVALLSSVLSYGVELTALRRLPTRVFGILMALEPAAAALSGWALLREALGAREVVALLMVSVASAGVTLGIRQGRRDAGEPALQPL